LASKYFLTVNAEPYQVSRIFHQPKGNYYLIAGIPQSELTEITHGKQISSLYS